MPAPAWLASAACAAVVAGGVHRPMLSTPATLGATRGQRIELTLTGRTLADVSSVETSFPTKVEMRDERPAMTELRVALDIPADTPVGPHALWVIGKTGASDRRPFSVDEFPHVLKGGKNKSAAKAQTIPVLCVAVGTADPESGDFYRFPVRAGEPITVEAIGRRLGSPIDPVILFYDSSGKELAGTYADDTPGLQADARVVFVPKESGDTIVEVRDTTYRGGKEFGYRLRVGRFPGVTTAFPLAVQRGRTATVGFAGPGAEGIPPVDVTAPTDPAVKVVYAGPRGANGVSGWPVPVWVSDHPEAVEREPNDDPAAATKLPVPGGVSARFEAKGDRDFFAFPGAKDKTLAIHARTAEVNSPAEVFLRVRDAAGTELARSDPKKAAARILFTPPADGDYRIECEPLNRLAGPTHVYHLTVTEDKE